MRNPFLHIQGIVPKDARWNEMKKIVDACTAARVSIPAEVKDFFGDDDPDGPGRAIELTHTSCCKESNGVMENGYEIDLSRIPDEVKSLRVFVSY